MAKHASKRQRWQLQNRSVLGGTRNGAGASCKCELQASATAVSDGGKTANSFLRTMHWLLPTTGWIPYAESVGQGRSPGTVPNQFGSDPELLRGGALRAYCCGVCICVLRCSAGMRTTHSGLPLHSRCAQNGVFLRYQSSCSQRFPASPSCDMMDLLAFVIVQLPVIQWTQPMPPILLTESVEILRGMLRSLGESFEIP